MNKEKLEQLQFLRFICFSLVFIRHASVWVHFPNPKGNVVNVISFFLMLSGFMTAYTMFEREPKLDIKNIFMYVFKKIIRFSYVYPYSPLTDTSPDLTAEVLPSGSVTRSAPVASIPLEVYILSEKSELLSISLTS